MTDLQGHASPGANQSTSWTRLDWVDYSKGIGIILVVFGHVWRGLYSASLPLSAPLYEFVDAFIYSFHMPLFFFLSDYFAERSANIPAVRFLTDKTASILYPYLLWSVLQGGMNVALSTHTNTPLRLSALVRDILYESYG
jgi:fucose 4-O-acetylase-like acetyltransferase